MAAQVRALTVQVSVQTVNLTRLVIKQLPWLNSLTRAQYEGSTKHGIISRSITGRGDEVLITDCFTNQPALWCPPDHKLPELRRDLPTIIITQ